MAGVVVAGGVVAGVVVAGVVVAGVVVAGVVVAGVVVAGVGRSGADVGGTVASVVGAMVVGAEAGDVTDGSETGVEREGAVGSVLTASSDWSTSWNSTIAPATTRNRAMTAAVTIHPPWRPGGAATTGPDSCTFNEADPVRSPSSRCSVHPRTTS